jgi:hypothetical protein
MTLAGKTINGANALAIDPTTSTLWAILRLSGQAGRQLVTVDATTGVVTSIGNTGDAFAGLAFDSAGTLFGVTGDGASTPETLFTLSKTTAAPTLFLTLGNGTDGEAIAFNPADGQLYHLSGLGTAIFEKINLTTKAITPIPLSGVAYSEALAAAYDPSTGNFLVSADFFDANLYSLTPGGNRSLVGDLDHISRGLAFTPTIEAVPEPSSLVLVVLGGFGLLGYRWRRFRRAA